MDVAGVLGSQLPGGRMLRGPLIEIVLGVGRVTGGSWPDSRR